MRGLGKILRPGKQIVAPVVQDVHQFKAPVFNVISGEQKIADVIDPNLLIDRANLQKVDYFKLQTNGVVKAERKVSSAKNAMQLTRAVAPLTLASLGSILTLMATWSFSPVTVALGSALVVGVFGYFSVLTFIYLRNVKTPLVHSLNPDVPVQAILALNKPAGLKIEKLATVTATNEKIEPLFKLKEPVMTSEKTSNQGAPEDADQRHLWVLPYLNLRPVVGRLGDFKISVRALNSVSDFKVRVNGKNVHVWVNPKYLEMYKTKTNMTAFDSQIAKGIQGASNGLIKVEQIQKALPAMLAETNRVLKETFIVDNDSAQYHWDTTRGQFNRNARWLAKTKLMKKAIGRFFKTPEFVDVAPSDRMQGVLASLVTAKECVLFKLDYAFDEAVRRIYPDDTAEIWTANILKQSFLENDEIKEKLNGLMDALLKLNTSVGFVNHNQLLSNYLNEQLLKLGVDKIPEDYAKEIGDVNQYLSDFAEQLANVLVEETLMRATGAQSFDVLFEPNADPALLAQYAARLLPLVYPEILTDKNMSIASLRKREQALKKLVEFFNLRGATVSKKAEAQLQEQDNFKDPTSEEFMSFMQYSIGMIYEQRNEDFDYRSEAALPDLMKRGFVQKNLPVLEKMLQSSDKKKNGWLLGNGGLRMAVTNQIKNVIHGTRVLSVTEEQFYRAENKALNASIKSESLVALDREYLKEIIYQKMVDFWEGYYAGLHNALQQAPHVSKWDAEELFFRQSLRALEDQLYADPLIHKLIEDRKILKGDSRDKTLAIKSELIDAVLQKIVAPQRQMIMAGTEGTLHHFQYIDGFVQHDLSSVVRQIDWGKMDIPAFPDPKLSGKAVADAEKIKLIDAFEWVTDSILDLAVGNSVIGSDFMTYQKIIPQMADVLRGRKILTGENPAAIRTSSKFVNKALNEFILFNRKPLVLIDENTNIPGRVLAPTQSRVPLAVMDSILSENISSDLKSLVMKRLFVNPQAERLELMNLSFKDKVKVFDKAWFLNSETDEKAAFVVKTSEFFKAVFAGKDIVNSIVDSKFYDEINKEVVNNDEFDITELLKEALKRPHVSDDIKTLSKIVKNKSAFKVYKKTVGDEYRIYKKKLLAEIFPEVFSDCFTQMPVSMALSISRAMDAFYSGKLMYQIELLNDAFSKNKLIDFNVDHFFEDYSREYVKFIERKEFLRLKVLSELQKPIPGKAGIPVETKSVVVDEIIKQFMNYLREERNRDPQHPHLVQTQATDGQHSFYIPKDEALKMWKPDHILEQIDPREFSRRIYLFNGSHENPDKIDKPAFRELWGKLNPATGGPMTKIKERDYYEMFWSRIPMDDRGRQKPTNISYTLLGAPKLPAMIKNELYWLLEEFIRLRAKGYETITMSEIFEVKDFLASTGYQTRSRDTFVDHGFEFGYGKTLRHITQMFDQYFRNTDIENLQNKPIEQLIYELLDVFDQQYQGPDQALVKLVLGMAKTAPLSVHKQLNAKFMTIFDKDNYPFTTFKERAYRIWGMDKFGNPVRNEHTLMDQTGQGFESSGINQNIAKKTAVLGMDSHTITSGRAEGLELNRPVEGCGYIAPTHLFENVTVMTYFNVFKEKGLVKNIGLFVRYFGFKGLREAWENSKANVSVTGLPTGKNWVLSKWAFGNLFYGFGMVGATTVLIPALPILWAIPVGLLGAWGVKRVLVTGTRLGYAGAALLGADPLKTVLVQPGQKLKFGQKLRLIYRGVKLESFDVASFAFKATVTQFLSNLRSAVEDKAMQDIMTTAYIKDFLKPGDILKSDLRGSLFKLSEKDIHDYFVDIGDFKKMRVRDDISSDQIKNKTIRAIYKKAEKSRSVHIRMGSTGTGLPIFSVQAADDTKADTSQKKRWYSSQVELVGQTISYLFAAIRRAIKFSILDARNNGEMDSRKSWWQQPFQSTAAAFRGIQTESIATRLANVGSLAYPLKGIADDVSALLLGAYLILGAPVFGPASTLAFMAFTALGMVHYSRVFAHIYATQKRTGHSKENIKDMMAYSEIQGYLLGLPSLAAFTNKTQMPFVQTPYGADFPILSLYHHKDAPTDEELQKFRTNPSSWQILRSLWKGMSFTGSARYWIDVIKGDIKGVKAYQTVSRQQWAPVAARLALNGVLAGVALVGAASGFIPVLFGGLTLVGLAPSVFALMVFVWPALKVANIMRGLKLCAKTEGMDSAEMYEVDLKARDVAIKKARVGKEKQVQK